MTKREPKNAYEGIRQAIQGKFFSGKTITEKDKQMYWEALNVIIDTETDKTILAEAYNERGIIYSGMHKFMKTQD